MFGAFFWRLNASACTMARAPRTVMPSRATAETEALKSATRVSSARPHQGIARVGLHHPPDDASRGTLRLQGGHSTGGQEGQRQDGHPDPRHIQSLHRPPPEKVSLMGHRA